MSDRGLIYQGARARLVARVNDAECQVGALLESLRPLEDPPAVPTQATCAAIASRFDDLAALVAAMGAALADSEELDEEASAEVLQLREAVAAAARAGGRFSAGPPPGTTVNDVRLAAQDAVAALTRAQGRIHRIVLPYRVKNQLHGLAVGRSLDIRAELADEIPSIDDRRTLLTEFSQRRDYFDEGVVDVENELIWRKSSNAAWRYVTAYAFPVLFTVLAGALLCLPGLFGLEWAGLDDTGDVLLAYLLVVAGVVAHLLIENLKQARASAAVITAIGEATDWLHLRWVSLALSFFPIVLVVVTLMASGVDVRNEDEMPLYFFAGYSVDSVAGLVLTRFGTSAKTGVGRVSRLLGGGAT